MKITRRLLLAAALAATGWTGRLDAAPPVEPALRSFERVLLVEDEGATSAGVSVGDIDGDGRLDLVLARGRHWPLVDYLLLGDGRGGFTRRTLAETPDRTYSAALADLDGDGDLDLVVSNDRPDRKLVYRNDGKGRFQETGTFGEPDWPTRYVTPADLNSDGFPDIVAANRNGSSPRNPIPSAVCFGDGKGGFSAGRPLSVESATLIIAADFDGDGAIDLFVPHRDGGRSVILWNDGQGAFPQTTTLGPDQSRTRAAAAGDLDGDGRIDLVVGGERGAGTCVYLNVGGRSFAPPSPLSSAGAAPASLAIADLNRDGRLDVVVGCAATPGSVFFSDGSGTAFREVRWNDGAGTVYGLAVGDFDGDGWPDLAAARSDAPSGVWFNTLPPAEGGAPLQAQFEPSATRAASISFLREWETTRTLPAPEAMQAAAAEGDFVYAISSKQVAKYNRATGMRLAVSRGEAQHLNSGFVWEGKLYCAHSNYPAQPERSEIKVLDPATMELTTWHDFDNYGGSLTWCVRRDGDWWCNFARYGEVNRETFLVRFADGWRETGRWTYPESVVSQLGRHSLSGGLFVGDHLLVTGHDDPVLFRLQVPQEPGELIDLGRERAPFTGQGIASDSTREGLVGINRARKEVLFAATGPVAELPPAH